MCVSKCYLCVPHLSLLSGALSQLFVLAHRLVEGGVGSVDSLYERLMSMLRTLSTRHCQLASVLCAVCVCVCVCVCVLHLKETFVGSNQVLVSSLLVSVCEWLPMSYGPLHRTRAPGVVLN